MTTRRKTRTTRRQRGLSFAQGAVLFLITVAIFVVTNVSA